MIDPNSLPPAEQIEHEKVRPGIESYKAARAAARESRKEFVRFERERGAIDRRDIEETADAKQKGAKDPGGKHLAAYEAKLADLQRQAAALELVEQRKLQDLTTTLEQHRDEWQAQLDAQVDDVRRERDSALEAAERLHEQLAQAYALRAFARDFQRYRPAQGYVRSMRLPRQGDGDVVEVSATFQALRNVGSEPVVQITNPAQVVRRWCVNPKFVSDGSEGGSQTLVGYRVEHDGHVYNPGDIFNSPIDSEVQAAISQGAIRELSEGSMMHEQSLHGSPIGYVSGAEAA